MFLTQAIDAIVSHVPQWIPTEAPTNKDVEASDPVVSTCMLEGHCCLATPTNEWNIQTFTRFLSGRWNARPRRFRH